MFVFWVIIKRAGDLQSAFWDWHVWLDKNYAFSWRKFIDSWKI